MIVSNHDPTFLQRLSNDSSGVERMRPLATMLHDQHVGLIGDLWDQFAKAKRSWAKTGVTAFGLV
ncbi:hypothetical protein RBSWK_02569 [Rhodopirellula baltica SWK14]|uniref:Uncharacterized protein n=1 Tax=Rhodopirellula baltica SWK14 TaxID=993516 RepID=L7CIR3_RHOBT|nr:hypothetical protein RBSWK_02569 [Rhodopirellula baltica SWK14]